MSKLSTTTFALSAAAAALVSLPLTSAKAQEPDVALTCMTQDMPADLKNALLKMVGSPMLDAEAQAMNSRGGSCRAKFNWSFQKTVEALAFAGFHLRANNERDKLLARKVPQATIAEIESGAQQFYTYNVQQDNPVPFNRWLASKGWGPISTFRKSAFGPYFEALAGAKVSSAKYTATP